MYSPLKNQKNDWSHLVLVVCLEAVLTCSSLAGTLRGGSGGADVGVAPNERPRLAMKKGGESTYSSISSKTNS